MEEVANNPTIEEGTAAADVIDSPKPDPTPDNTVTESVDDPAPAPVEETPAQNDTSSPKEIPVTASEETTVGPIKEPEVAEPQADIDGVKSNGEVPNKGNATESASPVKKQEKIDDEFLPPESDGVTVPPHWHAKPCVHLTSIGGFVTEEFNMLPQASGSRTQ